MASRASQDDSNQFLDVRFVLTLLETSFSQYRAPPVAFLVMEAP